MERYAECRGPVFDPILINKRGKIEEVEIVKSYELDPKIHQGLPTPKHLVYKVPEGAVVVASHNLEKKDPVVIQCNNPTRRAIKKAKEVAEEMAKKYNIDEFWLEEPSKIMPWIEPRETSTDLDCLL
ncbi:MAG: hypothetical protein J7L45_00070 [Candidatus Aenigmarchaeota archaeon]|nr:hypothetical protein [Candidatus Aenigmarchaeota archaeon]